MFNNYIKTAFRNMIRSKGSSLINLTGLMIGFTVVILIALFVQHELSYENFHVNKASLFRVIQGQADDKDSYAGSPASMGPFLKENFPEIVNFTRLDQRELLIGIDDRKYMEESFFFADPGFFNMFSFPLIHGNPKDALKEPNSIVITEATALKYFGQMNPIGQVITLDGGFDFVVTGVAKDVPGNSHFHFNMIIPFERIEDVMHRNITSSWGSWNYFTYFQLNPQTDLNHLMDKIFQWIKQDHPERTGDFKKLGLQPIEEIHYKFNRKNLEPAFDKKYIHILIAVAMAILIIACINFANLSTARSVVRSREVGLRKTVGANRMDLIWQFFTETFLLTVLSCGLAILMAKLIMPLFSTLSGKHLSMNYSDPFNVISIAGLIILTSVLAGTYPVFVLSSFKPASVLKGRGQSGDKTTLQNGLIVFQFAVSVILIVSTLLIHEQVKYIHSKQLMSNEEQIVNVSLQSRDLAMRSQALKTELLRNANVLNASLNTYTPSKFNENWGGIRWPGMADETENHSFWIINADVDFMKTFGIDLVEGEVSNYSELATDKLSFILNESALKEMGWTSAAGKEITYWGSRSARIAGVVKDFHFRSLHHEIAPCAIILRNMGTQVSLRIRSENIPQTLSQIKEVWRTFAPDVAFDYYFIDEDYDKLYRLELRINNILSGFSLIAIFIACIGLYGLTTFAVERGMKELGIRKVLGASSSGLVAMFSKMYVKRVVIANIIGWPVAWIVMQKWLENFAYRISINFGVFLLAGCIALIVALLTVSGLVIRAATANPVEAMRYE